MRLTVGRAGGRGGEATGEISGRDAIGRSCRQMVRFMFSSEHLYRGAQRKIKGKSEREREGGRGRHSRRKDRPGAIPRVLMPRSRHSSGNSLSFSSRDRPQLELLSDSERESIYLWISLPVKAG